MILEKSTEIYNKSLLDASTSSIREILLSSFPVVVSFIYFLLDTEVEQRNEYEEMVSSMKRDLFLIVEQRQWPHRCVPQKITSPYCETCRVVVVLGWRVYIWHLESISSFFFYINPFRIMKQVIICGFIKSAMRHLFFKIFKGINFLTYVKRLNLVTKKLEIVLTIATNCDAVKLRS